MKFTVNTVTNTKPELPLNQTTGEQKTDHIFFDERLKGFGLRVRAGTNIKVWLYQYSLHNRTQRVKIGEWPAMQPAEAYDRARVLHAERHAGGDPAHAKRQRQEAKETFGDVVRQYLQAKKLHLRPRTYQETERYLMTTALSLHTTPLHFVQQQDIAKLLNAAAAGGHDATANQLRAKLTALFGWAAEQGKRQDNPARNTGRLKESSRERLLSDAELAAIWHALPEGDFGSIVKILMLTGQRRNEIGGLRWSEIAGDEIRLPAERSKNKREHVIALSAPVREILAAQPHIRANVFGRADGAAGFNGWSAAQAALNARLPDMPHWSLHDLRRTMATKMAEPVKDGGLGVQPHVIEAILNHVLGGVAGTYNRARHNGDRRAALDAWAAYVMALVTKRPFVVVAKAA